MSVLSGVLLWLSWPVSPLTFLIFFAFVPLLLLEANVKNSWSFLGWTYLTLLTWNVGSTWWICNSTVPGGIVAILMNSLLMCIPWVAFYAVKKRKGVKAGYFSLLVFWMTFEYIHLNWELSWPWLTLGNVFAAQPGWVQWYAFTGSSGGSLWVMLANTFITITILKYRVATPRRPDKKYVAFILLLLFLPVLLSLLLLNYQKKDDSNKASRNIVVVQPNIDPYMKFESGMQEGQLQTMLSLSESQVDSSTALLVWPETALNMPTGINLDNVNDHPYLQPLRQFLHNHPQLTLLSGIEGFRYFTEETKSALSSKLPNGGYYESYNAAITMSSSGAQQFYYKSKLVPGVETLPSFLRVLGSWFEQFGGTGGGYTGQKERTVLTEHGAGFKVAPAICYESIFGEFLTGYTRNGANLICIITNDGWWANTSGHKQHMQYARLRAIENNRWIARSANTGISAFVSPLGEIIDPQPWDTKAAIKLAIPQMTDITFFAAHGDLISPVCIVLAVLLVLWYLFVWIKNRFSKTIDDAEKK